VVATDSRVRKLREDSFSRHACLKIINNPEDHKPKPPHSHIMSSQLIRSLTRQASSPSLRLAFTSRSSSLLLKSTAPRHFSSSPDDVLKGTISSFDFTRSYGFIKSPGQEQGIFLHENQILKPDIPGEKFFVLPRRGMKVAFKTSTKPDGKVHATDVTHEDGSMIRPFHGNYLENYSNSRKGKFGVEVYDIMDSVTEQSEMETRIVEAFEGVKSDIGKQKAKVEKILSFYEKTGGEN
jgi:cold shock CspA family protein